MSFPFLFTPLKFVKIFSIVFLLHRLSILHLLPNRLNNLSLFTFCLDSFIVSYLLLFFLNNWTILGNYGHLVNHIFKERLFLSSKVVCYVSAWLRLLGLRGLILRMGIFWMSFVVFLNWRFFNLFLKFQTSGVIFILDLPPEVLIRFEEIILL